MTHEGHKRHEVCTVGCQSDGHIGIPEHDSLLPAQGGLKGTCKPEIYKVSLNDDNACGVDGCLEATDPTEPMKRRPPAAPAFKFIHCHARQCKLQVK
jgi:hypothetical protein